MLTLRPETFAATRLPVSTTWLLADCMEFRGKQDLWLRRTPEVLRALRQQATVQSVESSNRIEGVTVAPERLRPIVLGTSRPKDRSEEELAGYRRALDWIHKRHSSRPAALNSATLLRLHAICQAGAGDAGKFKARDNEIIEFTPAGERIVRFRPTPARQTPTAVDALCLAYREATEQAIAPILLIVSSAVFDFLCIHPFRDGNGRVSRLLTMLLLQEQGFLVGRFVSLERIIEESKEDYYRVLAECSRGWETGKNEIVPWWNYFLSVLRRAYTEFQDRVDQQSSGAEKTELIRQVVFAQSGAFSLASIRSQLPGVSVSMIKVVLNSLRDQRKVSLQGRGRGARWRLIGS